MKHTVKKMISVIMVLIFLLTAFAACGNAMDGNKETTPSVNPGQTPKEPDNKEEEQDDPTRVFTLGDLEPLSKEKQLEVEEAWEIETVSNIYMRHEIYWCKNGNPDVMLSHRYYGTYNDCIVIYEMIQEDCINILRGIEVGGQKIESWWVSEIWVYHNGEFITINSAYENKLLTDDDISAIVKYNLLFEELEMGAKYDED